MLQDKIGIFKSSSTEMDWRKRMGKLMSAWCWTLIKYVERLSAKRAADWRDQESSSHSFPSLVG